MSTTHLSRSSSRGKGEAPAFVVVVLLRLVLGRAGGDDSTVAAKTPTAHLEHGGRRALGACSHGPCAAAVVRAAAFRATGEKGIDEKVVQREHGTQQKNVVDKRCDQIGAAGESSGGGDVAVTDVFHEIRKAEPQPVEETTTAG